MSEQNTKAWFEWRAKGIGASDVPIIMGDSPYKTAYELWLEKTGQVKSDTEPNFVQQKGHEIEVIARNKYEIETGKEWRPILVERHDNEIFKASLDGFNKGLNACWECKYIGKDGFNEVKGGKVPEKYKAQVQWQMFVSGANENHFSVMNDEFEMATVIVKPDFQYINTLIKEAKKFWNCVETKTPPKISDQDKIEIKEQSLLEKITEYRVLEQEIKYHKAIQEKIKKKIFELIPHSNCFVNENDFKVTIQKQKRSGAIDWKKLTEKLEIDQETQEKFRKKSSTVKIIKITEKKND